TGHEGPIGSERNAASGAPGGVARDHGGTRLAGHEVLGPMLTGGGANDQHRLPRRRGRCQVGWLAYPFGWLLRGCFRLRPVELPPALRAFPSPDRDLRPAVRTRHHNFPTSPRQPPLTIRSPPPRGSRLMG